MAPSKWLYSVIDQYSPDGTTVIGRTIFYVCPLCASMVPAPAEEYNFVQQHYDYHHEQAEGLDEMVEALQTALNALGVALRPGTTKAPARNERGPRR